eukprot:767874-Hanusia_phi.AAC.1
MQKEQGQEQQQQESQQGALALDAQEEASLSHDLEVHARDQVFVGEIGRWITSDSCVLQDVNLSDLIPRDFFVLDRTPWLLQHHCLHDKQRLVAGEGCHVQFSGQRGWISGWLTCCPPAHVVIDLGAPFLVTKVSIYNTNILASPRTMELWYRQSQEDDWTFAYLLQRAQCNRLGLEVPGNTDANDNESSSMESFYFLGHCISDKSPVWKLGSSDRELDEQETRVMANRGVVLQGLGDVHVARWWMLKFLDTNGSHYIGTNNFTIFGKEDPLPAPTDVQAVVVTDNGKSKLRVSWQYEDLPSAAVSAFKVVAFPHSVGLGAGGFEQIVSPAERFLSFPNLKEDTPYVFVVFAVDAKEEEGVPSTASSPVSIQSEGWTILDASDIDDAGEELVAVELDKVTPQVVTASRSFRLTSKKSEMKQPLSPEKEKEASNLKAMIQEKSMKESDMGPEEFAKLYDERVSQLKQGFFDEVEKINVATNVTMFLSSTFDDTTSERNYLMEFAYPLLKSFCQSIGLTFSVVDLRWGVRNEATDDHMTIDVCLGELKRCLRNSTAASFVFLSGERYGWRALPNRCDKEELELILSLIPDGDAKSTIMEWYVRDDNQVPPVYNLQKISAMKQKPIKYNDFWKGAQDVMQEAIWKAVEQEESVPSSLKQNWMISVTEREVLEGLFKETANLEVSAFVMMRTIEGLEEAATQETPGRASIYYTRRDSDRQLLNALRARVKQDAVASVFEFSVPWSEEGISFDNPTHASYIRELAAKFVGETKQRILGGLQKRRLLSLLEREIVHHCSFAFQRSQNFFGREEVREKLTRLIDAAGPIVRCLHGPSGAGKTSAMSAAAVDAHRRLQDGGVVIFRACGTSAASSSALELMRSICEQVSSVYQMDPPAAVLEDFDEQVAEFRRCLAASSAEKRLVLLIDSLDQLSDENHERSDPWRWLPCSSSSDPPDMPHARILVSTLPEEKYKVFPALRAALDDDWIEGIQGVDQAEAFVILRQWMSKSGRRLQPEQEEMLGEALKQVESVTMLHLRLLFDRVMRWKSQDAPAQLPSSVSGLIALIFDDLERLHGSQLVAEIMGLLCASRCGLSESNFLDLVSGNDAVLGQRGVPGSVLEYHDPPMRRLPPLVFSRLRRDLGDYLVERGENGVPVLNLYHRQFWELAGSRYFSSPDVQQRQFSLLADYFSGELAARFPDRQIDPQPRRFAALDSIQQNPLGLPNRQKIKELGAALRSSGRYEELVGYLCNLGHLEAVFESGRTYAEDLLLDFSDCLHQLQIQPAGKSLSAVTDFFRFVRKWFHVLCLEPHALLGLACNAPAVSAVAAATASQDDPRPWILWKNAPVVFDACTQTQLCQSPMLCCDIDPNGRSYVIGASNMCLIFDQLSSRQLARFAGHDGLVMDIRYSPDAQNVLSVARDGWAKLWQASSGKAVVEFGPHHSWLTSCAFAPLDKKVLLGSTNGVVYLWQYEDERSSLLAALEGHTGPVQSVRFFHWKETFAISGGLDGLAAIWNIDRRQAATRLVAKSHINCVDTSSDGLQVALALSEGGCAIWSSKRENDGCSFRMKLRLREHVSEVWSCAFSPDGQEIVTGAADRVGRIFSCVHGQLLGKIVGHLQWVLSVAWVGDLILTASSDRSAKSWDRRNVLLSDPSGRKESFDGRPLAGIRFVEGGQKLRALTNKISSILASAETLEVLEERNLNKQEQEGQVERKADLAADCERWAFTTYGSHYVISHPDKGGGTSLDICNFPFKSAGTTARWKPGSSNQVLVGGHGGLLALMDGSAAALASWEPAGWLMDMDWSPSGDVAVAACQHKTIKLLEGGNETAKVGPPAMSVSVSSSGSQAAVITMAGSGYDVRSTGLAIVNLSDGEVEVKAEDPILLHAKLQDRNCRWVCSDRYVVVLSAASNVLDCPVMSLVDASTGDTVCRFHSPHPSNFTCMDVLDDTDGGTQIVVSDFDGRVYLLTLQNLPEDSAINYLSPPLRNPDRPVTRTPGVAAARSGCDSTWHPCVGVASLVRTQSESALGPTPAPVTQRPGDESLFRTEEADN